MHFSKTNFDQSTHTIVSKCNYDAMQNLDLRALDYFSKLFPHIESIILFIYQSRLRCIHRRVCIFHRGFSSILLTQTHTRAGFDGACMWTTRWIPAHHFRHKRGSSVSAEPLAPRCWSTWEPAPRARWPSLRLLSGRHALRKWRWPVRPRPVGSRPRALAWRPRR